jgi:hypothetical protein
MLGFAALGSLMLWMRLKFGTTFERGSDDFVKDLREHFRVGVLIHLLMFVGFGAVLAVIMVEPNTYKQALAAGMAWTSLLGASVGAGRGKGKSGVRTP